MMPHPPITKATGYLLGKVQVDGVIRSEVLGTLVETLLDSCQTFDPNRKQLKFNESQRVIVECSEKGLKLTSPGFKSSSRSKDEGFESDSESLRSIKLTESGVVDLSELIDNLELNSSKVESETESGSTQLIHSSLSSGVSLDNTSLSSSTHLQVSSDDSNSSSGNGSDSDEFCILPSTPVDSVGSRLGDSPHEFWDPLHNSTPSPFQSYPIEDVLFCHSDSMYPSTLVWVVRQLSKMIALVTAFRTRTEAETFFQAYRELRVLLKPVKHKMRLGSANHLIPSGPSMTLVKNSGQEHGGTQSTSTSHPPLWPMVLETLSKDKLSDPGTDPRLLSSQTQPPKPNGFPQFELYGRARLSTVGPNNVQFESGPQSLTIRAKTEEVVESLKEDSEDDDDEDEESEEEEDVESVIRAPPPPPPRRKPTTVLTSTLPGGTGQRRTLDPNLTLSNNELTSQSLKPYVLVPLKSESVTSPKCSYPKESYLYHVMGRSASTFAPYQRSLTFLPQYPHDSSSRGHQSGSEVLSWGKGGKAVMVPFSSWMEYSEASKAQLQSSRSRGHLSSKGRRSGGSGNPSALSRLNMTGKGGTTAKILLRDTGGYHQSGMWATLSQRVKRNLREKLHGMWSQETDGTLTQGRPKRKQHKKVTFNAWATVQMV